MAVLATRGPYVIVILVDARTARYGILRGLGARVTGDLVRYKPSRGRDAYRRGKEHIIHVTSMGRGWINCGSSPVDCVTLGYGAAVRAVRDIMRAV